MVVSRWKYVIIIWPLNFAEHACSTFRCTSKDVCIDPDLVCDGVNHCGDNSDEATCQSKIFAYFAKVVFAANHYSFVCFTDNASIRVFGLELTWFVLLAVCTLLIISACIVGIAICVCRRYQAGADNQIRSKLSTSITYILLFEILMFRIICSQWITTITIRKASSRNIKTHIIPIRQQRYQCRETCITLRDNQGTAAKHTNCWWPKSVPFCARHVRHASVRPLRYIGEYGSEGRMVCMNNNNKHTTQTPNIVWQFWKKKTKKPFASFANARFWVANSTAWHKRQMNLHQWKWIYPSDYTNIESNEHLRMNYDIFWRTMHSRHIFMLSSFSNISTQGEFFTGIWVPKSLLNRYIQDKLNKKKMNYIYA